MGTETLLLASTGFQAVGSILQGRQQKAYHDTQAAYAQDEAQAQADKIRRITRRDQGAARAALAASGVDVNRGTAMLVDQEIGTWGEQDALNAVLTGKREASLQRLAGKNALMQGYTGVGSALMGGASQYSKWKRITKK